MKTCSCCKQTKERTGYTHSKTNKDGLQSVCKSCRAVKNLRVHEIRKKNLDEYLDKRCKHHCEICNVQYPSEILAFHHLDASQKKFDLPLRQWFGVDGPYKKTLDEAAKCAVLCHNCHALEHKALRDGKSLLVKDHKQLELL